MWPWGGALARLIVGPERCFQPKNDEHARHWTECYPTRALLPMMALVDHVRSLAPGSVIVPTLVVYSRDDEVVDPSETDRVMARLTAAPPDIFVVEGSTDPEHHVVAGAITSPETTEAARARILEFLAPFR